MNDLSGFFPSGNFAALVNGASEDYDTLSEIETIIRGIISGGTSGSPYNPDTAIFLETKTHLYFAFERTDGAGYISQRVDRATGLIIEESIDVGSIPADLTTLTYS